jgi:hypothetical protein
VTKNWFALFAGSDYYPAGGSGDFVACFPSREEAEGQVVETRSNAFEKYIVAGAKRDWYEIVDLREWIAESGGEYEV